jgi:replicative DNA helicase
MARVVDEPRKVRPDRVPPSNLEAEESVLGSMMLSAEAVAEVIEVVQAEDFYRGAHRKIYQNLLDIYGRGEPVDAITVAAELTRKGILEDVGGALFIHDLVERVPSPASAAYYARIVAELAVLRRLIQAAADIMDMAFAVPEDTEHAADKAESLIYAVSRRRDHEEVVSIRLLVDQAMSDLEAMHQRESAYAGTATGFKDVDEMLSGLQKGNLIVVAARPGVGKSSFVTNIARNVAVDERVTVAMFSLEMARWEIGMRLLCGEAKVAWDRIRNGRMDAQDWAKVSAAAEPLHDAPLYIVDSGNVTIVDIRAKARRLRQTHGLGLVIVDYLQLMSSHGRVESRQQEIAEISRSLKMLAKELEIPVIAVSQLNRQVENRSDKRPQLSDLRECVTGDTSVALANGRQVPIRDLVGTTPEVLAASADGRIVPASSDLVWSVGTRPVLRLRLASGGEILATARHRLLGSRGWRRVGELHPGDRVAIARRLPEPGHTEGWPDDPAVLGTRGRRSMGQAEVASGGDSRSGVSPAGTLLADPAEIDRDGPRRQATGSLFWDRVLDVVPEGDAEVFDLTVPGPASWVANGIVSHNSGAIEQDSDIVMFIHRDDAEESSKGTADVIVAKHRNGPTGTIKLTFRPHITQFANYHPGP